MSLLTQQNVMDYVGVTAAELPTNWQALLDLAESKAEEFTGADPFPLATVDVPAFTIETHTTELLLATGLLSTLNSISLNGTDILADVTADYWTVVYPAGFNRGNTLTFNYDTGWLTSDLMPHPLYWSILHTYERQTQYRGGGIQSERIGDYAVSFSMAASRELPIDARNSQLAYRRPRQPVMEFRTWAVGL